jgi:DNA-binding CsgD family transcriptional regulator
MNPRRLRNDAPFGSQRLVELSARRGPEELAELSPREREVLGLIARDRTNRQIADALVISEATARNHVSHILEKLALGRRSEAAALAARLGLLADAWSEMHRFRECEECPQALNFSTTAFRGSGSSRVGTTPRRWQRSHSRTRTARLSMWTK